jgi:hypothetical protein
MRTCTIHRDRPAGWRCDGCGRVLCPDCAAPDPRLTRMVRCASCAGVAAPLLVDPDRTPWWRLLPTFRRTLFSRRGLLELAIVGLMSWLLLRIPYVGLALAGAVAAAFFSVVLRQTALGRLELPDPAGYGDPDQRFFGPLLSLLTAFAVGWVPVGLWFLATDSWARLGEPGLAFSEPLLLGIYVIVLAYLPGALMVAAVTSSVLAVVNPLRVVVLVARIPGQYAATALFVAALVALEVLLVPLLRSLLLRAWVPVLSGVVLAAAALVLPALVALTLGRLVYQNAPALGWDDPRGDRAPALPGAVPRGVLPDPGRAAAPARAPEEPSVWDDLEWGPGASAGPARPRAGAPAPVPPDSWPDSGRDPWEDGIPLVAPDPARVAAPRPTEGLPALTAGDRRPGAAPRATIPRPPVPAPAPVAAADDSDDENLWAELGSEPGPADRTKERRS